MPGFSEVDAVNWALELEYDGTAFMGWQRQAHGLAIQQVVEEAGARICGGVVPDCVASGRTDAGVHALGQVVMMALPDFAPYRLKEALNYNLKPHAVAVLRAARAPEGWNPRFSAVSRTYRYVICNRAAPLTLEANRVWHVRPELDVVAMDRAAAFLRGHHDFSSFRASACQAKSPCKTLDELSVRREGAHVVVHAKARSFLHHQVRNMVGTLKLVGEGAWPEARVAAALAARARAAAGPTAPAAGLYLVHVGYEVDLGFA
jgi:tRNA pseudouridine38-40 synthase